jgi:hypothetical protein
MASESLRAHPVTARLSAARLRYCAGFQQHETGIRITRSPQDEARSSITSSGREEPSAVPDLLGPAWQV